MDDFLSILDILFIGLNVARLLINNLIYNVIHKTSHFIFFLYSFSDSQIDCAINCCFKPFWMPKKDNQVWLNILIVLSNLTTLIIFFLFIKYLAGRTV